MGRCSGRQWVEELTTCRAGIGGAGDDAVPGIAGKGEERRPATERKVAHADRQRSTDGQRKEPKVIMFGVMPSTMHMRTGMQKHPSSQTP